MRWIKRLFCKSKPAEAPKAPVLHVDLRDIELLRQIHLAFAQGCNSYEIYRTPSPERDYTEAEYLVKAYNMDRQEVLERTGFYIG
jgi:hypothetical protein